MLTRWVENYGSALQAASRYGHSDIVQLLLEHEADFNAQGGGNMATLCRPLVPRSVRTKSWCKCFFSTPAPTLMLKGGVFGPARQAACYQGSGKIMRVLLDEDARRQLSGRCIR